MSRADRVRTGPYTKTDAKSRLRQAEAYVMVAQLCLDDGDDAATPGVAASLAVLAAIASGDAACCHRLGKRSRAQDHGQAEDLIATIEPNGKAMAKKFGEVVIAKDDSHYGLALVSSSKAKSMVTKAEALTKWAAKVLAS